MTATSKGFFVREATGLVREIGPLNGLITTSMIISIGTSVAFTIAFVPFAYPGAILPLSFLIVCPFLLVHSAMLTLMAWSMPRSGGDFVWSARILHPSIGTSIHFAFFIYSAFINGAFISSFFVPTMIPALFVGLGVGTANAGLITWASSFFSSRSILLIISTIVVVYSALVNLFGLKVFLRQQLVGWVIGMVGLVLVAAVFVGTNPTSFAAAFDKTFSSYQTYENMIALAKSNGFTPALSLFATITALPFIWFSFSGYQYSMYYSGELKSIRKTMLWSTFGTVIITVIILAGISYLFVSAVGQDWLNAASYLANGNPSQFKLPSTSLITPFALASVLTNNVPVILLINISLIAWGAIDIPPLFLAYTRLLLGMSFDRLLPSKFAYVSDRYHTPTFAIGFASVLMYIGVLFGIFFTFAFSLLNTSLAYSITLAVGGITATVFPFVKKDLYRSSPISKYQVGSAPLVSVVGIITFAFFAFLAFEAATNTNISSALGPGALITCLVIFVGSGLIYFVSKAYRRRKDGIDIALAFQQLPPE
jgi:APA family basic amino acid/polyamine antiporter